MHRACYAKLSSATVLLVPGIVTCKIRICCNISGVWNILCRLTGNSKVELCEKFKKFLHAAGTGKLDGLKNVLEQVWILVLNTMSPDIHTC